MNAQHTHDSAGILGLCRDLPQWINRHHAADAHGSYRARELDCSFNGLPTLTVDMSGPRGPAAAYKCNITLVDGGRRPWLLFSPLVVVWEMNREQRGPGFGRAIIDHSVAAISGFCKAHLRHFPDVLITSGNLTAAKAGRPFFEALGWDIADPRSFAWYPDDDGLVKTLAHVAGQIDAALAPLRQSAPGTVDPTSFAMLRLRQADILAAAGATAYSQATGLGAQVE